MIKNDTIIYGYNLEAPSLYIGEYFIMDDYAVSFLDDDRLGLKSDFCLKEVWKKANLLHREIGPAVIVRDRSTGKVLLEEFYRHNELHRDDGPARLERSLLDEWTCISYFQRGQNHRIDGPSLQEIDSKTGIVIKEKWALDGRLHRDDGPAFIYRSSKTGVPVTVDWYRRGKHHRVNGPARTRRDEDTGVLIMEEWLRDGGYYRENGHATIYRDEVTGEVTHKGRAYLNGVAIADPMDYIFGSPPQLVVP